MAQTRILATCVETCDQFSIYSGIRPADGMFVKVVCAGGWCWQTLQTRWWASSWLVGLLLPLASFQHCVLFTCCFYKNHRCRMAVWLKFSTPRQFNSGTTCGRHTTAAAHIIGKRSRCWGQLVVGGIRWCGRVCWVWLSTSTSFLNPVIIHSFTRVVFPGALGAL